MKKLGVLIILCVIILCGCEKQAEINGFSMDAPYSIRVNKITDEETKSIKELMASSDSIFDAYESSYLYLLNETKELYKTNENEGLFSAIEKSLPYCGDYFDISIREYTKLWNFSSNSPVPPTDKQLKNASEKTGFKNIIISNDKISLKNGSSIELGAVAKGYMCDKAYDLIKHREVILDIGGTVKSSYEKPITVGVRGENGSILCSFEIKKGEAVSTSGSYERNFTYGGKLYHHILDPKTGMSVENNLMSVTVISDSAFKSDILSTLYFVAGIKNAEISDDVTVIFVLKDGKIEVMGKNRVIKEIK